MIQPLNLFGRDHFSLLAYVETCCVDSLASAKGVGILDRDRVRCNPITHPMLIGIRVGMAYDSGALQKSAWRDSTCGTVLADGTILKGHDDYDCLDDLEEAGLVEVLSLVNGFVRMTANGVSLAHRIREHKAKGGSFSNFKLT